MEASLVHTYPDISMIDSFNGTLFKWWHERVLLIIDVVNLGHILTGPKPKDDYEILLTWETTSKQVRHTFLCIITNELFNVYC